MLSWPGGSSYARIVRVFNLVGWWEPRLEGTRVDLGLELPGQSRMAGNGQRDSCLSGPMYVQRLRKLRTTSTLSMSLNTKCPYRRFREDGFNRQQPRTLVYVTAWPHGYCYCYMNSFPLRLDFLFIHLPCRQLVRAPLGTSMETRL